MPHNSLLLLQSIKLSYLLLGALLGNEIKGFFLFAIELSSCVGHVHRCEGRLLLPLLFGEGVFHSRCKQKIDSLKIHGNYNNYAETILNSK